MSDPALVGSCHCGQARIGIPAKPDYVLQCNCSLCSKTGFQGIYFPPDQVAIEGEFDDYVRADSNPACISVHRCRNCGIATHWTLLTPPPHNTLGINARLFEPGTFEGVEMREVDGLSRPA